MFRAGGGGNTDNRKERIRVKNGKLNDERVRRIQGEEMKRALKADGRAGGDGEGPGGGNPIDESAVHPSRRRMVPAA